MLVWNNETAAVAAAHSVDPDRWQAAFGAVMDRIAPRFARYEPLRHAAGLMLGHAVAGWTGRTAGRSPSTAATPRPDGLQHLLGRAKWDADAVRDDLRGYVVDHFGDPGAVLVVDETGDLKKGTHTVGVQRQYTGTAGRIENAQVAVYLTYAARRGHAFIDRALYLPKSWTDDPDRCAAAGVPDERRVRDQAGAGRRDDHAAPSRPASPAGWVAGDEVYGADPRAARAPCREPRPRATCCRSPRTGGCPPPAGPIRVDQLPALLPAPGLAADCPPGAGSKGERLLLLGLDRHPARADGDAERPAGQHHLLIRRNDTHRRAGLLRCYARDRCRCAPWSGSPGSAGASRSPSRPPRA